MPTTGAEGRAGEPTEGSPQGDTSGAREATSAVSFLPVPRTRHRSAIDIDLQSLYFFPMTAVTVSSKYQIVIPREARRKLGISSGTRLQAISEESGLRLVKEPSIDEVRGLLKDMPVYDSDIRNEEDRELP